MASLSPRERANRCFAVARSTTFDGERESAIARGIAIAEKAGLDLGSFDIPGRRPAGPTWAQRFGCTDFPARKSPETYSSSEFDSVMASFRMHMRGGRA